MRIARSTGAIAAASLVVAGVAAVAGPAHAADPLSPATSFTMTVHQDGSVVAPTEGAAIPNIDSVKSTLRAYYGATKQTDPAYDFATDGKDGDDNAAVPQTTYVPNLTDSAYAKNTKAVAAAIDAALPDKPATDHEAVVFDVDSTLLSDYANEEDFHFNYSPAINAIWVNHALFPAVPGMPALLQKLAAQGYHLYGITGRPGSQEDATLTNLKNEGYTTDGKPASTPLFTAASLYTKDLATQPWVDCTTDGSAATACSTVEYKALTRHHIETTDNVSIAMNVGDQWSDLEGGYAAQTQKVPNPSYFLPSPTIPSTPDNPTSRDSAMLLPTTYTMAPDGSSGLTATDGDKIPNEGAVVSLIRAYYKATGGIADKNSSPYISELTNPTTGLVTGWTQQIQTSCQKAAAAAAAARSAATKAAGAVASDVKALAKARTALQRAKKQLQQAKRHHATSSRVVNKKHRKVEAAKRARTRAAARVARDRAAITAGRLAKDPAVVLDADDTTLWTYDMEDGDPKAEHRGMQFTFDPALQDIWVQGRWFAATPGMTGLVKAAATAGCTIVGLTGRNDDQKAATIANLTDVGYVDAAGEPLFTAANYYTKWTGSTPPAYIDCVDPAKCTTIEYKAGTRKYLETQKGLDIVANLGDQFSDLKGGYADTTYKLPNPTYYLP